MEIPAHFGDEVAKGETIDDAERMVRDHDERPLAGDGGELDGVVPERDARGRAWPFSICHRPAAASA